MTFDKGTNRWVRSNTPIEVDRTRWPPHNIRERRAAAYISKIDSVNTGRPGHDQAYRFARLLWADFALSEDAAWLLLLAFHRRCRLAKDTEALRRKLDQAVAAGGARGRFYADRE